MKFCKFLLLLAVVGILSTACSSTPQLTPPAAQPQSLPTPTPLPSPIPINKPNSPVVQPVAGNQISPVTTTSITTSKLFTTSQPEKTPPAEETLSVEVTNLVAKAKEFVVQQVPGVDAAAITVISAESQQWRDSSLGCPQVGMMYNQVVTPGYLIVLKAEGKEYAFHTDATKKVVLCLIEGQQVNQ